MWSMIGFGNTYFLDLGQLGSTLRRIQTIIMVPQIRRPEVT
ncbi:hypothetical protein M6B38_350510 [Iris pallida]|uniref:Uncharacterized protein n=1 Tax=Iris pallida TaxID=29817 RepID=A0AAX6GQV9_IRIPA|nr:hypothetical protein M6B38_350510 [Iris pallida]